MIACPSCGQENPDGFRLCGMCGTSLVAAPAPRQERKVVTVLFCDLVGFTQRAEQLDPEDVRALLTPYQQRVRAELERHGGTVEKFIGDAVMALFGAPISHEDDPERAVRAALAIRDFATEEGIELRVGITTGEALVALDVSPAEGEGMASGDVVNTAARLQAAAPVNGVLADETTYRATRHVVGYAEAGDVEAKGKSSPVEAWQALDARARFGVDVAHEARAALVGREHEVTVLQEVFARARHGRTPQLVTLVGIPGIGKSRLVYETWRIVDADPELITWRQGRCLAYGDGITLWALGEIVKAQAGIAEQDSSAEIDAKVRRAVEDVLAGTDDVEWVASHLRPLVGVGSETGLGGDRRGEAFAAWRRFLEALAEQRPLVLVFEDLHWADESLLDFVDALVDWTTDVPLLVVATARPELLERRPGWAGGKLNATTLALSPLSDDETALLISRLLERSVLPAGSQQALLERAGGNPLYAEQFVDLFVEHGSADDLALPETLQGIISARIDGLSREEKELLRDASVIGKVFWASALSDGGGRGADTLHSLYRKGFVRRQKRSSVEGESEFAFAHALVRDVAYGQIARTERAEKHRRVATWIESLGRPDDHAEMLAYHWSTALQLAQAAGADATDLGERAMSALRYAGDRAFRLNAFPTAARYFGAALELWPDDDARSRLLFRRAHALMWAADESALTALEDARDALLKAGDREGAAEAEALLAQVSWYRGLHDDVVAHLGAAGELTDGADASPATTRVLAISARYRTLAGGNVEGLALARQALAMAEAFDLDELRAHALVTIGTAKFWLGDPDAETDLHEALAVALEANSPIAATALNNLSVVASTSDLRRSDAFVQECCRLAERMGDLETMRFAECNLVMSAWQLGRWDEALADADEFIASLQMGSAHYMESPVRETRASIRLARGEIESALEDYRRACELAGESSSVEIQMEPLFYSARAFALLGRIDEARALAHDLSTGLIALQESSRPLRLHVGVLAPFADAIGIGAQMRRLVDSALPGRFKDAAAAALDGDFQREADIHAEAGFVIGEADARLQAAEALFQAGRREEGAEELEKALAFYRSVGATFYVERGEALLTRTA